VLQTYTYIAIECVRWCSRTVMVFRRVSEMLHDDDCTNVRNRGGRNNAHAAAASASAATGKRTPSLSETRGGFIFFLNEKSHAPSSFSSSLSYHLSLSLARSVSAVSLHLRHSLSVSSSRIRSVSIIRVHPTGPRPPIYRIFSDGVGGDKSLCHRCTTPYHRFSLVRYTLYYI